MTGPRSLQYRVRLPTRKEVIPGGTNTLIYEEDSPGGLRFGADDWPYWATSFLRKVFDSQIPPAELCEVYGFTDREWYKLGTVYGNTAQFADGRVLCVSKRQFRPPFRFPSAHTVSLGGQHDLDVFREWGHTLAPRPVAGYGPPSFSGLHYDAEQDLTTVKVTQSDRCD